MFLFSVSISSVFAAKNLVSIASEQNSVQEYYLALQNLNKALETTPRNPELHFQRGVSYINLNKWENAKKSFTICLSLSKPYVKKISKLYSNFGKVFMEQGKTTAAARSFKFAKEINPEILGNIPFKLYERGNEALIQGRLNKAQKYYDVACLLQEALKQSCAESLFQAAHLIYENNQNTKNALVLFRLVKRYATHYNEEIGKLIIDYAITNQEDYDFMPELKSEAMLYLSESEVNANFPITHKELPPNQWFKTDTLKNLQLSKVWWRTQQGHPATIRTGAMNGKKFSIYLEDKSEYANIASIPNEKMNMYFKFRAQEDNVICAARFDR
jgi:tetratricopeptide (TPR) repeat protein